MGTVSFVVYSVAKAFTPKPEVKPKVNLELQKDSPKVVNLLDIEDMDADKVSYCRCWRSKKVGKDWFSFHLKLAYGGLDIRPADH